MLSIALSMPWHVSMRFTLKLRRCRCTIRRDLRMHELLEQTIPHTPEARAHLDRLGCLQPQVRAALEGVRQKKPGAKAAVLRAAEAILAMWHAEIRRLPPIVFIRRPPYEYTAIGPYYLSFWPIPKPSSLCVLDPARPDEPPRVIHDEPQGAIYDASLSYDGLGTVFFSALRPGVEGDWHIYEIGTDGSGLRQITHGPSANISPVLLPDGKIMFVSTRRGDLCAMSAGDGRPAARDGPRWQPRPPVSANIDSDQSPQVMDDGRVLFARWTTASRRMSSPGRPCGHESRRDGPGPVLRQHGRGPPAPFGRPLRSRAAREVVCVLGPHHSSQAGSIGLVWNRLGQGIAAGRRVSLDDSRGAFAGRSGVPARLFASLADARVPVSLLLRRRRPAAKPLYLVDDRGNRQCIYEDDKLGCWNPLPLRARKVAAGDWLACDAGRAGCQGIGTGHADHQRRGPGHRGVCSPRRGRTIQIMEQVEKTQQRVGTVRGWGTINPIIGRGTVHVKRVIGRGADRGGTARRISQSRP